MGAITQCLSNGIVYMWEGKKKGHYHEAKDILEIFCSEDQNDNDNFQDNNA